MIELIAIPVVIVPFTVAAALIAATRGMCYFNGNNSTDNEKLVRMASEISLLSWPSRMHNIRYGRGHLREYWVFALKILMKISGIKGTDHVNIVLALICNAGSAVLVFYVGRHYFGDIAGLFVFFLYVSCLWPYQVVMGLGHVLLSQALFLLSVLVLTLTGGLSDTAFPLYLAAGVLIGVSFSSSSSSRKFPFLFLAAFLYQSREFFVLPYASDYDAGQLGAAWALVAFGVPALVLVGLAAFGKQIGTALIWLAEVGTGIKRAPERYAELLDWVPRQIRGYAAWGIAVLVLLYVVQPDGRFYANAGVCLAGLGLVAVHVLAPNFISGVLRYRMWMDQTNWLSHFLPWRGRQPEVFGRELPHNFRGGGISWVPRFLARMVPTIVVTYLAALLILVGVTVERVASGEVGTVHGALTLCVLVFASLIPIIVSELTRSLQLGKAYFPSFLGLLLLIGAGTSAIVEVVEGTYWATAVVATAGAGLLLAQTGMTIRALVDDIIPARMGTGRLYRFLKDREIGSFYTYDNPYNNTFVNAMLYSHPDEFAVTYIDNIEQANGGIVVVPPTSSKSVDMSSEKYGIENGDFRSDPVLAELLETEEMERVALAKLGTRGSSRYFVHEGEVTTYRDLFLKQIGDHDRWLSHGWVLDTKRLNGRPDEDPVSADLTAAASPQLPDAVG